MPEFRASNTEKEILKVIKNEIDNAQDVPSLDEINDLLDRSIFTSEELLQSIGRNEELQNLEIVKEQEASRQIVIRPFDELLSDANERFSGDVSFSDIFSPEEIAANSGYIKQLRDEFDEVHKLDSIDIIIPALAGILGGAVDCLFGGFIRTETGKNLPGTLSNYIGELFDKALPPDKIVELENLAKVTYDAQDNRNTKVYIETLSSYFHRFLQLGHDPILGFIFGVADMLRGSMTTIDYTGRFVIQSMEVYSDRKATSLFEAIAKVFLHMLSDVNTPQGLPVPFMALFNKIQSGSIGPEKLNIAELVKGMYGQGYDFRHFFSMSIPVMIIEVVVRVLYFAKRLSEGFSFSEALPIGLNQEKKPKLGTMLFIAHSASSAINAGKVLFTEEPLNINYAQWLLFARYSIKQLKWVLHDKPELREKYVFGIIDNEWDALYAKIDGLWDSYTSDALIVFTK